MRNFLELAEIEGATSARLLAQDHGSDAMGVEEFVYGVPQAALINASFAYAKPRERNRFNGPRTCGTHGMPRWTWKPAWRKSCFT